MFSSTIFRLTLLSSLAFWLVAVIAGWIYGRLYIGQVEAIQQEEQQEITQWVSDIYEEDGLEGLEAEFTLEDDGVLWSEEAVFHLLLEEEAGVLIESADGEPLLGYPGFADLDAGWQEIWLEELEDSLDVRPLDVDLGDDLSGVVVLARSHDYYLVRETMEAGFFWLCLIVLPLSLLTGFALSRRVYLRLNTLSETVERIGGESLAERLPVADRRDEFDRLALQVNAMLDRIETLNQNLKTTSVGIAHDLKTPMSRISNRLQLMEQDIEHPEALQGHLNVLQAQVASMIQTFQGLLRLGEIESGARRERFQTVDVSVLVEELVESYEPVFADAGRVLEHSIVPALRIQGDPDLLNQMLSNLLENSIEHGRESGKTWVRLQPGADGVLLQVGDDGPGVPEISRSRIFERFYRGDISRGGPGNGLGLSLVQAVCELHGGSVVLLSGQQGAVFDCVLPGSSP